MNVTFLPSQVEYFAQKGDNVMNIAAKANVFIEGNCGGRGKCGKCKVKVISGRTVEPDTFERSVLTEREINDGYRLACRLTVEDNLKIEVPNTSNTLLRKTKLTFMPNDFEYKKNINKHYIELKAPSLENQKSDVERIFDALPDDEYTIDPLLLTELPSILSQDNLKITVVARERHIIALEIGDTTSRCYGIAFDIGTTTVVGMLWDLNKGELVGVSALTNPQGVFGADVISRINYSSIEMGNLQVLKSKIQDCLNEIINNFKQKYGINYNEIYEATVVGNTTMSHLFLGVNPEQLAISPFAPVFTIPVEMKARDLGMNIYPLSIIHLLPNIAGHVGSDIVGVLLTTRITEKDGIHLAIDVGTNGEIVLTQNGRTLVCSTAAGPAFEGAAIYQGMRAAPGAIEGVKIEKDKLSLQIIDNEKPIGICGSGLIDAIAQLLNTGVLDYSGRFVKPNTEQAKNIHPDILRRLRKGNKGNEFVLAQKENGEDIVITQKDIREVQLAKAAIRSGIASMLHIIGADSKDIETIILAGAFGNYIKKESALRIGLFPDISPDKIILAGNAAGAGACMALLSKQERTKAYIQAQKAQHVELAGRSDFQTEFLKATSFPIGQAIKGELN